LVETRPTEQLDLTDGVKILNPHHDSWVLVLPDAGEPLVHLHADSPDRGWVDETLREYRAFVQEFVDEDPEIEENSLMDME
jgi:mannose-1-phosphate guanylyltransferase / phosphomannomutase